MNKNKSIYMYKFFFISSMCVQATIIFLLRAVYIIVAFVAIILPFFTPSRAVIIKVAL